MEKNASIWKNRGSKPRKVLIGWNLNYVWFYKRQKEVLSNAIDEIDTESEIVCLSAAKYMLRKNIDA